MDIEIKTVRSKADVKKFVKLPYKIYKGCKNWVPPLEKDIADTIDPAKTPDAGRFEREVLLAICNGETVGRIYLGIDKNLNNTKNESLGHFSLFECVDDIDIAKTLFEAAMQWFKEKGIKCVRGPVSPTGADSDECKGLLMDSFDTPPTIMNSYNPDYYEKLIEACGFVKDYDLFAYKLDAESLFSKNPEKTIEYAKKRYNFRVDTLKVDDIEEEIKALKHVMDLAVPENWPDLVAPSMDDFREMAKKLLPAADPDIIAIARSGDEAVGFGIALPDYNQILIHLKGRITPLAALKYLWYKRRISLARFFVMFVTPEFRKKGVSYAIYYNVFSNGVRKGYKTGDGSTIGEDNLQMRNDIESFGGIKNKTYRVFKKEL
jgi:GNAT superfamily N-acetyltransferase